MSDTAQMIFRSELHNKVDTLVGMQVRLEAIADALRAAGCPEADTLLCRAKDSIDDAERCVRSAIRFINGEGALQDAGKLP